VRGTTVTCEVYFTITRTIRQLPAVRDRGTRGPRQARYLDPQALFGYNQALPRH
jgi:hypothetical protein